MDSHRRNTAAAVFLVVTFGAALGMGFALSGSGTGHKRVKPTVRPTSTLVHASATVTPKPAPTATFGPPRPPDTPVPVTALPNTGG